MTGLPENEAGKLWCPAFTRSEYHRGNGIPSGESTNRPGNYQRQQHPDYKFNFKNSMEPLQRGGCIGSACMAWRWSENVSIDPETKQPPKDGDPHGFCGLGGRP